MSEKYVDDADWATAAEQSSEDDEAQEGNVLAAEERSSAPAEHLAVHVVDDEDDDSADDEDIDIDDPEADAIVNDALEIDEAAEAEAAAAEAELRRRTNESLLRQGVTMVDPAHTYIDATVRVAKDVTLFPGTILQGQTVIGAGAEIGPDTRLVDCVVGEGAIVEKSSGRDAEIGSSTIVGPFAALEPGAHIASGTRTGAFYTAATDDDGAADL